MVAIATRLFLVAVMVIVSVSAKAGKYSLWTMNWLIGWLIGQLIDWFVDWLADWLVG